MATTATLTLNSDITSQALSFSTTSTSDLTLFASGTYSRSYVYLRNMDDTIAMDIDFGSTASFNLAAGEFAFFPWHASQNIVVAADSGTPYLEYAIFEA